VSDNIFVHVRTLFDGGVRNNPHLVHAAFHLSKRRTADVGSLILLDLSLYQAWLGPLVLALRIHAIVHGALVLATIARPSYPPDLGLTSRVSLMRRFLVGNIPHVVNGHETHHLRNRDCSVAGG
jgi:hypothetical protein